MFFTVNDPNILSDHTVIYFEYENVVNIPSTNSVPDSYETVNYKFVWNGIKQTLYTDALKLFKVSSHL